MTRRKPKLKRILKQDLRVTEDRAYGNYLVEKENEMCDQLCIAVPNCFKQDDKVRVTVELIKRDKSR